MCTDLRQREIDHIQSGQQPGIAQIAAARRRIAAARDGRPRHRQDRQCCRQSNRSPPLHSQDANPNAWITGTTIIADAAKVCLNQMDSIELYMDDPIRLEYAFSSIQNSVDATVSALHGIFSLMANGSGNPSSGSSIDSLSSVSSASSSASASASASADSSSRSRASSNASAAFGIIKRAFLHSHMLPPPPPPKVLRAESVFGAVASPLGLRQSVSAACPTRIPHLPDGISNTPLAHISPTLGTVGECVNPFGFGEAKGAGRGTGVGSFSGGGWLGSRRMLCRCGFSFSLCLFLLLWSSRPLPVCVDVGGLTECQ